MRLQNGSKGRRGPRADPRWALRRSCAIAHGRRLLDTLRGRWPPVYRTLGAGQQQSKEARRKHRPYRACSRPPAVGRGHGGSPTACCVVRCTTWEVCARQELCAAPIDPLDRIAGRPLRLMAGWGLRWRPSSPTGLGFGPRSCSPSSLIARAIRLIFSTADDADARTLRAIARRRYWTPIWSLSRLSLASLASHSSLAGCF